MKPSALLSILLDLKVPAKLDCKVISHHVAAIVMNSNIILVRSNKVGCPDHTPRNHSRSRYGPATIHSEIAVLRDIPKCFLKGADLYVWRVSRKNGKLLNSKPCSMCEPVIKTCMVKYGLKRVFYSSD